MTKRKNSPGFKGHRFPPEIIEYAVWLYFRFSLSLRDVEDLLSGRGIIVSCEAVRLRVNRFGQHFSQCVRRDRPRRYQLTSISFRHSRTDAFSLWADYTAEVVA